MGPRNGRKPLSCSTKVLKRFVAFFPTCAKTSSETILVEHLKRNIFRRGAGANPIHRVLDAVIDHLSTKSTAPSVPPPSAVPVSSTQSLSTGVHPVGAVLGTLAGLAILGAIVSPKQPPAGVFPSRSRSTSSRVRHVGDAFPPYQGGGAPF